MALKINGDIRHIGNNFSYVDEYLNNPDFNPSETVSFSVVTGTLAVESLRIFVYA
jgi:hypothetical protein